MSGTEPSADAIPIAHAIYARARKVPIGPKALSLKAKLNETYVRDLYTGDSKNPTLAAIDKIAEVLGCTIDDLAHPERSIEPHDRERYAETEEEALILRAWKRGGDRMREELASAVERVAMGSLARFIKR